MNKKIIGLVLAVIVIASAVILVVGYQPKPAQAPHYDVVGFVTQVVDGDTIDLWIEDVVADLDPAGEIYEDTDETVRFGGGVDAPELAHEGGPEAGNFTNGLCPLWTKIYLDLDNLAVGGRTGRPYRDKYERLVAVIYVKLNGQWINVNAELLRWGQEEYPDHDWLQYLYITSDFDGREWLEENYSYVRG
ncbi:MAG: hypothetical protein AVW06_03340 [Hadesarchaea archaeon DG-33-1]|nr:MAG: hypothetical protein AVW06_03340 [Hadesarchaea archaeon DG-33-1]